MSRILVYQIYFDADTEAKLLPGFIPLDNRKNERPDWFEFWVILNYLRSHPLEEESWYGFFSPRFHEKTALDASSVFKILGSCDSWQNVALFTPDWDQLAYFLNPWEQGEVWHPGLTSLSQAFVERVGFRVDLRSLVTDLSRSVFANYIVAKKEYWSQWRTIAEQFFEFVERGEGEELGFAAETIYGGRPVSMKTFIQERFATLILATGPSFNIRAVDQSLIGPVHPQLFPTDALTRRMLQTCDLLKARYRETTDREYLDMYWKIRRSIRYTGP